MKIRPVWGVVALAVFVMTIPAANWTLDRFGFVDVPWLGPVASGAAWAGLAFVMRDVAQLLLGKWWVLVGIALGAGVSWWVASPSIVGASVAAFTLAETLDWLIYTPLANRHFVSAVVFSSIVGSTLDSALFLYLAFDSTRGWWQLAVAKWVIVGVTTPLAWAIRQRLVADEPEPVPV